MSLAIAWRADRGREERGGVGRARDILEGLGGDQVGIGAGRLPSSNRRKAEPFSPHLAPSLSLIWWWTRRFVLG